MSVAKATLQKYNFFNTRATSRYLFSRTAVFPLINLLPLVLTQGATVALIRPGIGSHLKTTFRWPHKGFSGWQVLPKSNHDDSFWTSSVGLDAKFHSTTYSPTVIVSRSNWMPIFTTFRPSVL